MAASSPKSFAGQGSKVHGTLCLCMVMFMVLLDRSVLVMASIHPADPERYPHSAEIGKTGLLVFEITQRGKRPEHICVETDYNCTTPHGLCIDDRHKYRLEPVEYPVFERGQYKWFCGLEIEDVSVNDVGKYEIWKRNGVWNPGFHDINFAVWERDAHCRICQTSYDETSKEIINNCTSLTTHPSTTTERSTKETCMKILSAVGIPGGLAFVIIVILIIGGALYLYKKRSRRRQIEHAYYSPN